MSSGLSLAQLAPGQLRFAIRYHVEKKKEFSLSKGVCFRAMTTVVSLSGGERSLFEFIL